jgi:hypothetical protein
MLGVQPLCVCICIGRSVESEHYLNAGVLETVYRFTYAWNPSKHGKRLGLNVVNDFHLLKGFEVGGMVLIYRFTTNSA